MDTIVNSRFNRFKDAEWFLESKATVLVGGAGGIGSWVCFLLARAGFKIYVCDFDMIEAHNLGGQLYSKVDIGKYKVDALAKIIEDFCDETISKSYNKIDENSMTAPLVISAFDNMKARLDMFNSWQKVYGNNPKAIFIDGRLLAEQLYIYCITGGTDEESIERQKVYREG